MIVEMAKYLSSCPFFDGERVELNYLDCKIGAASVEMKESKNIVREYADGGVLMAAVFKLAVRGGFGLLDEESRQLADRLCRIEKWIEEQNLIGNLPGFEAAVKAVSVGVVKCFCIERTDGNSARYEAEIELIYLN